jgi:hypothetical protein
LVGGGGWYCEIMLDVRTFLAFRQWPSLAEGPRSGDSNQVLLSDSEPCAQTLSGTCKSSSNKTLSYASSLPTALRTWQSGKVCQPAENDRQPSEWRFWDKKERTVPWTLCAAVCKTRKRHAIHQMLSQLAILFAGGEENTDPIAQPPDSGSPLVSNPSFFG